ncbi:MAG: hypothetical protein ACK4S4_04570 [Pyrinomonadaceae bacterium]
MPAKAENDLAHVPKPPSTVMAVRTVMFEAANSGVNDADMLEEIIGGRASCRPAPDPF